MLSRANAVVGQSGGPTAAINATLSGVIRGAFQSDKIDTLYGMVNGVEGLLSGNLVNLNYLKGDEDSLARLSITPASALGSARYRLPLDLESLEYEKIFKVLSDNNIKYVFYIGGNDSMDTVCKLSRYAKEKSLDVSIMGVPKTVDNDLALTDHTPGFGSSAKYLATTVCELGYDVSVYNVPSVTVLEVMGREAGWLGCACALPKHFCGVGADLVYLPEGDFKLDRFLADVENQIKISRNVLVAVSEGVNTLSTGVEDAFGHKDISGIGKKLSDAVKLELGCKTRGIELSLPQRCAAHLLSRTDIEESIYIGQRAVDFALEGESGKMASFKRRAGQYGVDVIPVDASLVANEIKHVPKEFINSAGNFVTDKCIEYLSPLIMGEINVNYKSGLPHFFRIEGDICTK